MQSDYAELLGHTDDEMSRYFKDYIFPLALAHEDLTQFIETVNTILVAIPYSQVSVQNEPYYHIVFYLTLSASGVLVHTEPSASHGRIDIAVEFKHEKTNATAFLMNFGEKPWRFGW